MVCWADRQTERGVGKARLNEFSFLFVVSLRFGYPGVVRVGRSTGPHEHPRGLMISHHTSFNVG